MNVFYQQALRELAVVLENLNENTVQQGLDLIQHARRISLYGVGREGLQIKGFAMRLYHLGLRASVVGEMTTPPLAQGDLLIVSAGPGWFSTVDALLNTARQAGAATLCITAQPAGVSALKADRIITLPAQTMADAEDTAGSVLPLGSLYEGALFLLFENIIVQLQQALAISAAVMSANHTNLE
ncbi:6-phospho-3-hexuloisomerase [Erwinia toletana]|uniref:6-phospho-3-hexuloisomerase n=1 Tax=Winslowiella toletana TaxID=92490 RepID=A0ABS4P3N6_9GAMM|nr:SIS domain-containing protein [Winslowiella toletana]MBP2167250.1 6-phospho-3-hexuloisomerase [Winslowiella toletana]